MSLTHVSDHFSWQEFDCHSGEEMPDAVKPSIRRLCVEVLELIRKEWSSPIIIVSGWRSEEYNKRIGGAGQSRHVTGEAADIRPVSLEQLQFFRSTVERMIKDGRLAALGGYGVYRGWLHVDVRMRKPNGMIARWEGRGVGSEQNV